MPEEILIGIFDVLHVKNLEERFEHLRSAQKRSKSSQAGTKDATCLFLLELRPMRWQFRHVNKSYVTRTSFKLFSRTSYCIIIAEIANRALRITQGTIEPFLPCSAIPWVPFPKMTMRDSARHISLPPPLNCVTDAETGGRVLQIAEMSHSAPNVVNLLLQQDLFDIIVGEKSWTGIPVADCVMINVWCLNRPRKRKSLATKNDLGYYERVVPPRILRESVGNSRDSLLIMNSWAIPATDRCVLREITKLISVASRTAWKCHSRISANNRE